MIDWFVFVLAGVVYLLFKTTSEPDDSIWAKFRIPTYIAVGVVVVFSAVTRVGY